VLRASHDDECNPTECIPHFCTMPSVVITRCSTMSSSFTARFPTLPMSPDALTNSSVTERAPSSPKQPPDEALLATVAAGGEGALGVLFRRHARSVRAVGQRMLRDHAEADDLVQEVFLYIHRRSELFDRSKGSARSWIFQVAYTQALIRRRQLKSHGFYASAITDRPAESGLSCAEGAHYDNTVEGCFGKDGWTRVWHALTDCQRETLRLHFYEGCTFTEIAERLGQSFVNVRHHYYRGLEKLRRHADDNNLNWP
jgi:RNA polymerase sigma-70 factor (ECF subfamily)